MFPWQYLVDIAGDCKNKTTSILHLSSSKVIRTCLPIALSRMDNDKHIAVQNTRAK